MKYKIIDIENWKRKENFEHYLTVVPCTYSISFKLDITKIKEKKLKLYPTTLYYLTKLVNKNDLKVFGSIDKMMAKPHIPENNFIVSMISWTNFEGFNINTNNFNYLTPIFTLGKYLENHGKYFIPLEVQHES